MKTFHDPADVPAAFGPSVVAIGKFDGVHSGHRAVLERARVHSSGGAAVVAVTFDRNPLSILMPQRCPESLLGNAMKLRLLAETGIDATLMLRFDAALAELSPREFVRRILVDSLHAQLVLVGEDFRFGHRGEGNPELLAELGREYGFVVDVVADVRSFDADRRVSSTWIRELITVGDVATAAKLLGRSHSVTGEVVHGLKRGRELGFPTANLSVHLEGFVPADGIYAGWLVDEGSADGLRSGTRYPAAISVGTNPPFDDVHRRQVEAYVLDETDIDLYGHHVEVQFVERIRGMVAFEGIPALIDQMTQDVARVRTVLAEPLSWDWSV